MAASVNFFTPINYLNHEKGVFAPIRKFADNYFYYGGKRAYVIDAKGKNYDVQLLDCKAKTLTTALKIASLATIVIPLTMLLIKAASRIGKTFTPVQTASAETRMFARTVGPQNDGAKFDPEDSKQRYVDAFAKVGLDYDHATPLQKHVAFFTDEDGNITKKSTQKALQSVGLGKITAFVAAFFIVKGLAKATGAQNDVLRLENIHRGKHPSDTGVYTETGEIDEEKFEGLKAFAQTNPEVLTAGELAQLRSADYKRDKQKPGALNGRVGAEGEFRLQLKLFGDKYLVDSYGNATPAISFDRLREFYTNGPVLFDELAQKYALAKEPEFVEPVLAEGV